MSNYREEAAMPYNPAEDTLSTSTAQEKLYARLMAIEGVEGVGTGQDAIGNEGIVVFARDAEAAKRVPRVMDGMNVEVQITGAIEASEL